MTENRIETDSLGEIEVPANRYYGAQTERARQNFPVSGLKFQRRFIEALGRIKGEASVVNAELGGGESFAGSAGRIVPALRSNRLGLDVIGAAAEGYPFPTNLDTDPPIGGLASESQAELLFRAIDEGMSVEDFETALTENQRKRLP